MRSFCVMLKPSSGCCNMRCEYCFYCDEMKMRSQHSYGFMTEETLKNTIRKTISQATQQITYLYQGGEPLLRGLDFFRRAMELQQQYNRNHITVHNALQTNGFALNEDWCRFFKENDFLIGVSVDGTRQIHDRYRRRGADGGPTYDQILANIALLEKYGVEYNILTVVTEAVAQNAAAVYRDYQTKGWMYQQYIECLDPLAATAPEHSYSLQPLSYGIFLTQLFELWYQDLQKGKQPYIRKFDNYVRILAGYLPEACEQRGECGIQIVVEADGSAYPCDFYMLDSYRLGNFNEDRLPQMDQRRAQIGFIPRSKQICAECKGCAYSRLCRSGCMRSRNFIAQEQAYQSRFCQGYRYFFDHCIDRLRQIAIAVGHG